jgi:hypothetical protein
MSRTPVRIKHVATANTPLVVRTVRLDVAQNGEPESLRAEQHVAPGEEIVAHVYEGGALVIVQQAPAHAR